MSTLIYPVLDDPIWIAAKKLQAERAEQAGDTKRAQWLRDMIDPTKPISIPPKPGKLPKKKLDTI